MMIMRGLRAHATIVKHQQNINSFRGLRHTIASSAASEKVHRLLGSSSILVQQQTHHNESSKQASVIMYRLGIK